MTNSLSEGVGAFSEMILLMVSPEIIVMLEWFWLNLPLEA